MLNINLNLIDPAEKKNIQLQKIQYILKDVISIFFITSAVLGSFILISRNILEESFAEILKDTTLVRDQNQWFTKEVNQINQALQDTQTVQAGFFKWSHALVALSQTVPNDSKLDSISISLKDNKVVLRGISRTRLSLLSFKETLAAQDYLKNVSSPLTNLLQKENINFEFQAIIESDKL